VTSRRDDGVNEPRFSGKVSSGDRQLPKVFCVPGRVILVLFGEPSGNVHEGMSIEDHQLCI
jgi:hypothetical protein